MLGLPEATVYVLRRSFVTPEAIVDGNLRLVDVSRRNFNMKVISDNGNCYLLKQGIGQGVAGNLPQEAAAYTLLGSSVAARQFWDYMPSCVHYDKGQDLLLLELIPDSEMCSLITFGEAISLHHWPPRWEKH
jgi:hypothetical protein